MGGHERQFPKQKKEVKGINPLLHISWLITEPGVELSTGCTGKKTQKCWGQSDFDLSGKARTAFHKWVGQ